MQSTEKEKERAREYYKKHRKEVFKRHKEYQRSHKNDPNYKRSKKERARRYHKRHREEIRKRQKEYYEIHRDAILQRTKEYYYSHKDDPTYRRNKREYSKRYHQEHTTKDQQWIAKRYVEVIKELGGKCEMCGINNMFVLNIHHKNGRVRTERKNAYLSKDYPKEQLQVLCANCHTMLHRKQTGRWSLFAYL